MKIDFQQRMCDFPRRGFSLVEVVLAIGVVSFALVVVIGIFGGMMKSSDDNTQRREMAEAVDALRGELREANFESAYKSVREEDTLYYLTYRAGTDRTATDGDPDPDSEEVVGQWFSSSELTDIPAYEAARSGRWLRARLAVSPSNPGGTSLPAEPSAYTRAVLLALVKLDAVATPNQSATNSGVLEVTLPVTR